MQNIKGIRTGEICAWTVTLSYVKALQLAKRSLNNLCFSRMEWKKQCLHSIAYNFYEGIVHHSSKFIVSHFLLKIKPQMSYIWRSTTLLERIHGLKKLGLGRKPENSSSRSENCWNGCLTKTTKNHYILGLLKSFFYPLTYIRQ